MNKMLTLETCRHFSLRPEKRMPFKVFLGCWLWKSCMSIWNFSGCILPGKEKGKHNELDIAMGLG